MTSLVFQHGLRTIHSIAVVSIAVAALWNLTTIWTFIRNSNLHALALQQFQLPVLSTTSDQLAIPSHAQDLVLQAGRDGTLFPLSLNTKERLFGTSRIPDLYVSIEPS
jgi:hypothetical protein